MLLLRADGFSVPGADFLESDQLPVDSGADVIADDPSHGSADRPVCRPVCRPYCADHFALGGTNCPLGSPELSAHRADGVTDVRADGAYYGAHDRNTDDGAPDDHPRAQLGTDLILIADHPRAQPGTDLIATRSCRG